MENTVYYVFLGNWIAGFKGFQVDGNEQQLIFQPSQANPSSKGAFGPLKNREKIKVFFKL